MNSKQKDKIILKFRNGLANQGIELDLKEAEERYRSIRNLVKKSRNMCQLDIWRLEEMKPLDGFTEDDHNQLVNLYKYLIENEV